jgi:hypothetical protein
MTRLTQEQFYSCLEFLSGIGGYTDINDPEMRESLWDQYCTETPTYSPSPSPSPSLFDSDNNDDNDIATITSEAPKTSILDKVANFFHI